MMSVLVSQQMSLPLGVLRRCAAPAAWALLATIFLVVVALTGSGPSLSGLARRYRRRGTASIRAGTPRWRAVV